MAAMMHPGIIAGAFYPSVRNYVAEGDSITDAGTAVGSGYATASRNLASPAFATFSNKAVSGSTLASMIARAAACDAALVSGAANVLSVFIGANNTPDTDFLTSLASYLDARRAAGWYVILCTILPHDGAPFLAARATANPEMRLWTTNGSIVPGKHCDRIADFGADPLMGPDGAQTSSYFSGDHLHPTLAGQTRLRGIFWPVLDASMRNGVDVPVISTTSYDCETGSSDLAITLRADRGVTWSASGDAELTINELCQLTLSASTLGTYTTTLTATDANGRSSQAVFTWIVNDPPVGYGPNLLLNPKGDNGLFGWGTITLWLTLSGTQPLTVTPKAGGGNEFCITGNGGGFPQVGQTVAVANGATYRSIAIARRGTTTFPAAVQTFGGNMNTSNLVDTTIQKDNVSAVTSTTFIIDIFGNPVPTGETAFFDNLAIRRLLPVAP